VEGEGGCEVMQWKKTCQFEGICPIAATKGAGAQEHTADIFSD